MNDNDHSICELKIELAVLKERGIASDKALRLAETLAEKAVDYKSTSQNSTWTHTIAIIAALISLFVLIIQFYRGTH